MKKAIAIFTCIIMCLVISGYYFYYQEHFNVDRLAHSLPGVKRVIVDGFDDVNYEVSSVTIFIGDGRVLAFTVNDESDFYPNTSVRLIRVGQYVWDIVEYREEIGDDGQLRLVPESSGLGVEISKHDTVLPKLDIKITSIQDAVVASDALLQVSEHYAKSGKTRINHEGSVYILEVKDIGSQ